MFRMRSQPRMIFTRAWRLSHDVTSNAQSISQQGIGSGLPAFAIGFEPLDDIGVEHHCDTLFAQLAGERGAAQACKVLEVVHGDFPNFAVLINHWFG